ncbi:unknown protein [Microcystis aeruginosa NIES-843]|uniref:Uncharacterized protein n=1 Tax=Microcystis aeruginosa (strain NIES-843 / IAM M-2473) TaxID=449447 RepID=B0JM91_MICAN|nr:unknown protein [Microcystis aeruginosa NIES-843]
MLSIVVLLFKISRLFSKKSTFRVFLTIFLSGIAEGQLREFFEITSLKSSFCPFLSSILRLHGKD